MKRILLSTAYLTVIGTLAVAQQPVSSSLDKVHCFPKIHQYPPTASPQSADEFSPLNNAPFFPGGQQALEKYMETLDPYPHLARQTQLEGTVRVGFRVLPSGQLINIQVVESRGPLLDQAATQAVALMPRWYPAHRAGVAVSHRVELAITFRLD
jgi:TonB family protein